MNFIRITAIVGIRLVWPILNFVFNTYPVHSGTVRYKVMNKSYSVILKINLTRKKKSGGILLFTFSFMVEFEELILLGEI